MRQLFGARSNSNLARACVTCPPSVSAPVTPAHGLKAIQQCFARMVQSESQLPTTDSKLKRWLSGPWFVSGDASTTHAFNEKPLGKLFVLTYGGLSVRAASFASVYSYLSRTVQAKDITMHSMQVWFSRMTVDTFKALLEAPCSITKHR